MRDIAQSLLRRDERNMKGPGRVVSVGRSDAGASVRGFLRALVAADRTNGRPRKVCI